MWRAVTFGRLKPAKQGSDIPSSVKTSRRSSLYQWSIGPPGDRVSQRRFQIMCCAALLAGMCLTLMLPQCCAAGTTSMKFLVNRSHCSPWSKSSMKPSAGSGLTARLFALGRWCDMLGIATRNPRSDADDQPEGLDTHPVSDLLHLRFLFVPCGVLPPR